MNGISQNSMKNISILILITLFLSACTGAETISTTPVLSTEVISTPKVEETTTPTPLGPATIEPGVPLAANINNQGITLEEYQVDLVLARAASETGLVTFTEEDVLQNLIDEVLLEQGAAQAGYMPDDAIIQARLTQLGMDDQILQNWLTQNGYTQEIFERKFFRAIAAAWMRDQIMMDVPKTAEQVKARQILLYNATEAENAYAQLQSGTDFATLATQYDPESSGDLGWFPRGYLTVPELDNPVFSLQIGDYTEIIESKLGYHIVQVIDRDTQRALSPRALRMIQTQAVRDWLMQRRSQSDIKIFSQ
jgi:parvulin-like peptidyl-prolyl isomerase